MKNKPKNNRIYPARKSRLFQLKSFSRLFSPVGAVVSWFGLIVLWKIVFKASALELASLVVLDAAVLNLIVDYVVDPKIFSRFLPSFKLYSNGIDPDQMRALSKEQKAAVLAELVRLPAFRAGYNLVGSLVYKSLPVSLFVLFFWDLHHSVLLTVVLINAAILFFNVYISSVWYVEFNDLSARSIEQLCRLDPEFLAESDRLSRQTSSDRSASSPFVMGLASVSVSSALTVAMIIFMLSPAQAAAYDSLDVALAALSGLCMAIYPLLQLLRFYSDKLLELGRFFENSSAVASALPKFPVDPRGDIRNFQNSFNALGHRLQASEKEVTGLIYERAEKYRMQSLGELSAMITHDLAGPLSVIKYCCEQAFDDKNYFEDKEAKKILGRSISRSIDLIEGVRAYMRDDETEAQQCLVREAYDYARDLARLGPKKSIFNNFLYSETNSFGSSLATAAVARSDLIHILYNLYSNSIKHFSENIKTNDKAYLIQTWADLSSCGNFVEITVSDNGRGLSAQEFVKLTGYSEHGILSKRGPGLGLRLVARLCNSYGGSIRTGLGSGENNQGTRLVVRLPVSSEADRPKLRETDQER